ncbi:uncharacterized protein NECHADRAFT_74068 [Fusarium vanettenii 77-13-4]|uniref:DUF6987 domain-containing protein n=1 Tax=Fusarium vanettenii (strain ATCC MYA-4622 / CBS 123669 / FGSC 9596 / NRRL 45880 / 77-13-4) TaxID=660122 RepID=C7YVT2_FUSV7|nr:uncharacterized protein NECHADRAFT_74068 [Fusarium vanettenii 77-13-4]EEU44052.1 hypothetical protein NECHADRAFT_74068 [Fusarium vanettenii 77-13-4]
MSNTKDPTSIPEGQVKDSTQDTASKEQQTPGAFTILQPSLALIVPIAVNLESVPRSATGVVNDAGDVLDDAGKTVGHIADTDNLKNLVGNTVNAAGDVVSSTGDVLGKTLPIRQGKEEEEHDSHDEEHSEYTTQPAEKKSGGLGDTVGGLTGAVGKTVGGVTDTAGKTVGGVTDTASQTAGAVGETGKSAVGGVTGGLGLGGKSEGESETSKDIEAKQEETSDVKSESQKDSTIGLEDRDLPTGEKEAPETQEKLKELAPEEAKEKTTEGEDVVKEAQPEEETGDDLTKKPEEATEKAEDVVKEAQPEDKEAPSIPEGAPQDEAPTSEIPEGKAPGEDELPEGKEAEGELPEGELPEGQGPPSELPKSEAPEIPGDEEGESKAPGTEDLKSVAPGEEAAGKLGEEVEGEVAEGEEKAAEGEEKLAEGEEKLPEGEVPEDKLAEGEEKLPEGEVPEDKLAEQEKLGEEGEEKAVEGEEKLGEEAEKLPEEEKVGEEGEKLGEEGEEKLAEGEEKLAEGEEKVGEVEGEVEEPLDFTVLKGTTVDKQGNLVNDKGHLIGRVTEGEIKQLIGMKCDDEGVIWGDYGKQLGKAEPLPEWERGEQKDFSVLKGTTVDKDGNLVNNKGDIMGHVVEGEVRELIGMKCDDQGIIWGDFGKKAGKAEPVGEWERGEEIDFSILKGTIVDKDGNLVNEKGHLFGRVIEGEIKQLIGLKADENGKIWSDGKVVGKAEPLPEWERGEQKDFSVLKNCKVDEAGNLVNDKGDTVGRVVEGEIRQLKGLKSDENGKIWSDGKVVGRAEPLSEWERTQKKDLSVLKGTKVNKAGKLVDSNGNVVGKVVEGELKELIGKRCDENGDIWNDSGEVIGKGDTVSAAEREDKAFAPFENFPGATVEADGRVMFEGRQVGEVIEGDLKTIKGSTVDEDGDILDRRGNVVGKAKVWEEPEPEAEAEVDKSALAGKRVNKAGNVVSRDGEIYGRVVEGHIGSLVGRMCDKDGNIRSESGDIIGKAELVTEGEREGLKEGPFAELQGCTVAKDGKVVTPAGDVVGRLTSGDPKVLFGRAVDDDGEILDKNGNVIGKAERWEEPEVEKKQNPLAGRKVNREGNVNDQEGNIIGKLTSGDLLACAGKEIDQDGDVINNKGETVGHVSLLEDIPPEPEVEEEEPGETEEERLKREQAEAEEAKKQEQAEKDKKLAGSLAYAISQTLDKIRPICKQIDDKISAAEAQPKEERDEEELVRQVRPLIEEGGKILTETNGTIRGLDPDGRIQKNAKQKVAGGEATPEEAHLAELLKELTGSITSTIDNAKRKLEGMPHAKKELNPLWALLAEPLFQIIAAVGLLLSGVLGLVGKIVGPLLGPILGGLGLGGLLDGLLGGLGLNKVLSGLGLGDVVGSLTGKKKK